MKQILSECSSKFDVRKCNLKPKWVDETNFWPRWAVTLAAMSLLLLVIIFIVCYSYIKEQSISRCFFAD